ncbi:DUF4398 domain-containing protein [Thiohalobacter thiocyanaticus]|uniref:DUF4398 domain-containing protein n=1 Tax=Thiohalobacter thiocyanaticus TaxID=585455 RepID=A0A426QHV8_9GAMM|nr:DUF4398 domain-containing protein [Thiohalobacter thiocyanaticus]RRQ21341.1 DUF4398 domain-containing protein [Thiohalobacter thiocyanaticus]
MYQSTNRSFSDSVCGALSLIVAFVLLSACASAPLAPTASLNAAREAIASAEQAGARQYAGAELDEAQQKLIKAEGYVNNEKMIDAERFAQQSLVAAELASARTEAAKAEEINREMGRGADALIEEMRRTGDQQ